MPCPWKATNDKTQNVANNVVILNVKVQDRKHLRSCKSCWYLSQCTVCLMWEVATTSTCCLKARCHFILLKNAMFCCFIALLSRRRQVDPARHEESITDENRSYRLYALSEFNMREPIAVRCLKQFRAVVRKIGGTEIGNERSVSANTDTIMSYDYGRLNSIRI